MKIKENGVNCPINIYKNGKVDGSLLLSQLEGLITLRALCSEIKEVYRGIVRTEQLYNIGEIADAYNIIISEEDVGSLYVDEMDDLFNKWSDEVDALYSQVVKVAEYYINKGVEAENE